VRVSDGGRSDEGEITSHPAGNVPSLSEDDMGETDRIAMEEFGITLPQMMENAGRLLASLSRSVALSQLGSNVCVLVGKGNNGGGGLVAARHLHNRGCDVSVVLSANSEVFKGVPKQQLEIAAKLGLPILVPYHQGFLDTAAESLTEVSLIIDALIGYGLRGDPRGTTSDLIEVASRSPTPVLALDVPWGLDTRLVGFISRAWKRSGQ
jgi:NAD(P)H-hydrate epimerase